MARLRYNGLSATLGASLTSSATSVTFGAALTHSNGTNVPTIVSPDYIPLAILDSSGHLSEIVWLTAYTAAATTGTITRGQESTTGVAHSSGDKVICSVFAADVQGDAGWTAATLVNSWVTNGGAWPTPGFRKGADGRVYLRGVVKSGTSFSTIFTLPTGYRPAAKTSFAPLNANAGAELDINTDGTVVCSVGSTAYVGLDGASFFTD
jgi:hypothetical protein